PATHLLSLHDALPISYVPSVTVTLAATPTDAVRLLIGELEDVLSAEYPPENRHGLSLEAVFQPHVRFFVATLEGDPVGCGGVARSEEHTSELQSLRHL